MKVQVNEELDRDKVLDEAIFLSLCGLDHCRTGFQITGVVRLEMAYEKLGRVIKKIKEDIDKGNICTPHS